MHKILLVLLLIMAPFAIAQGEEPEAIETTEEITEVVEEEVVPVEEPVENADVEEAPVVEEVERSQSASMDLKDIFIAGGNFMWPLLIALIIGIAVAVERFITFSKAKLDVSKFLEQLGGYIRKGDLSGAETLCDRTRGPVSAILRAGLMRRDKGLVDVEKAIEGAGSIEMAHLEKGLVVLATVSSVAPMIGFLGTVSGMIRAFGEIAAAKNVDASLVAGGIQEALITTASGLIVAIPIQMANNYFIAKVGRFITEMEEASMFLVDQLADMEHLKQL
ncbi:MAG: MotA/TolQ/ExbB proton channel family protein [Candidatus Fermentibacteria bacterium]|nr:MotA/TolQ/ExbB proton channel family protein [Candidatus Fermentibacteria bacterium]